MAEAERGVLSRQCLGSRRFRTKADREAALSAWVAARNAAKAGTRRRFATADARIQLKALDPLPDVDRWIDYYGSLEPSRVEQRLRHGADSVRERIPAFLMAHCSRYFLGNSAPATNASLPSLHIWYTLMRKSGHVVTRQ